MALYLVYACFNTNSSYFIINTVIFSIIYFSDILNINGLYIIIIWLIIMQFDQILQDIQKEW